MMCNSTESPILKLISITKLQLIKSDFQYVKNYRIVEGFLIIQFVEIAVQILYPRRFSYFLSHKSTGILL